MYWEVGGEEGWARQSVVSREKLYTKKLDFRQLYTFESSLVISECFCRTVINTRIRDRVGRSPIHYSAVAKNC